MVWGNMCSAAGKILRRELRDLAKRGEGVAAKGDEVVKAKL